MEGAVWPELQMFFQKNYGLADREQVIELLDPDFRWIYPVYLGPELPAPEGEPPTESGREAVTISTKQVAKGPLAGANTVAEVHQAQLWPDPKLWGPPDFAAARRRWPDHALVFCAGWTPLFWGACEAFGMEEALVKILTQPEVFEAFVRRQHEFYYDLLARCVEVGRGLCDLCWLGDDFAGQQAMLVNPELWRRFIKPYLAEQVAVARRNGMFVLYHSCGAVRPVLPDLIEIGVNALLVFQTTAAGMEVESIAAEFGGKMAFYGGVDAQQLLSFASPEEVARRVFRNAAAFRKTGGYIAANSHHGIPTIKGENILAMCRAARETASLS
jgi:uroporphyrinogen decarboxylase